VKIRDLEPHLMALVAVAVLLDGNDAAQYLQFDREKGQDLLDAANELSAQYPDLRIPLAGTLFREAIEKKG
jgi:hypothetical protein